MKFRAIFENYEKDQKKKTDVFQFGGAAESRKFLRAAEGGNFGAAEGGKISKFSLKFRAIFENSEKDQKKTDVFEFGKAAESRKILRAAEGGNFRGR